MSYKNRVNAFQQILGNPLWGFLGTLATILALGISIYSVYWSRPQKALQVTLLAHVLPSASGSQDIKVLYKGNNVDNFSVFIVRFDNIGNQSVRVEDYYRPITFLFPEDSKVLYVNKIESTPSNIEIVSSIDGSTVGFFPFLLNKNDKVILEIGVINAPPEFPPFTIQQRILDINEVGLVNAFGENQLPTYLPFLIIAISIFINMISGIGRRIRLNGKQLSIQIESPISYQMLPVSEQKSFYNINRLRNRKNIYAAKIKIDNTGTFPVTDSNLFEWRNSIKFELSPRDSEIIDSKINTPQNYTKAQVEFHKNKLSFSPEIINPGDEVFITCIVRSRIRPRVLFDSRSKRIAKIQLVK